MYIQINDVQDVIELLHFYCTDSLTLIFCIYKKYKTGIISSLIINAKYDLQYE